MPDFRLPRRAASKVDFVAPRPKFVWPRREPLCACSDAAAYVPDDGGREPGTGVLRPVRGVRGPRDERYVSARGTGRARAQGWLGPRLLPKRRAHLPLARCRLRGGRIEVLWYRLEDCEAQHRARGRAIAHRHGPSAARECRLAPRLSGLPNERPILPAISRQFRGDDHRGFRAPSSDAIGTDAPRRAPHDYVRLGTPEDHRLVEGSSSRWGSARVVAGLAPTT